ncbi:GNAT family N-acetyltransferase [Angustibacter aerolatus]
MDDGPVTTLHPVDDATREVVERLWQLFQADLSAFRGSLPDDTGRYRDERLRESVARGDLGYLVRTDGRVAGFVLVRRTDDGVHRLPAFWVARAVRRSGVGLAAVRLLLARHRGRWEIAFQEDNPAAAAFWRQVGRDAVGDASTVEQRPVPGRPDAPPDSWLCLTVG